MDFIMSCFNPLWTKNLSSLKYLLEVFWSIFKFYVPYCILCDGHVEKFTGIGIL